MKTTGSPNHEFRHTRETLKVHVIDTALLLNEVLMLRHLLPVQLALSSRFKKNGQNLCRNIFGTSRSSLPKIV